MALNLQGAVTTGALTYAIERFYNREDEPVKLGALSAACHVGANIVSNRTGLSHNTSTVLSAAAYSFAAPKVFHVNDPDGYMKRFLLALGANYGGDVVGGKVGGFMYNMRHPGNSETSFAVLSGDMP